MTHQDEYKLTSEMAAKGMETALELMCVTLNNAMQWKDLSISKRKNKIEQKTKKDMPTDINQKHYAPG